MVDTDTLRRLALSLPEVQDLSTDACFRFEVRGGKGFAWTYMKRVDPKKPRVAQPEVLAIRCAMDRKEMLMEAAPERFFEDDHYRGYTGVLVRLAAIDADELAGLLKDAWRMVAPKPLLAKYPG
jgi:hypothetical protein